MNFSILTAGHIQRDISLLDNISRQDPSAFLELYDRYSALLYSTIVRVVKEKKEAEDILQEVFLNIWRKTEEYDQRLGNPNVWLCRIARNVAVRRLRSKNNLSLLQKSGAENFEDIFTADLVDNPKQRAILSRRQEEILIALTSLSNEQKMLVEYTYFRGCSQSELAEHFKLPISTVKTRIHSVMSILRQKLHHQFV